MQQFDTQLLLFINHDLVNPVFDVLMPALSLQGYLLALPFLIYLVLQGFRQQERRGMGSGIMAIGTILIACLAVYLTGFVEDWMKETVARVRPCRTLEGIRLILLCPKSYSMPSGHAISSFALAAPLFFLTRTTIRLAWRFYPVVLASLIAFSRMYLGVHYPTDVLAGAVLGAIIGMLLSILWRSIAIKHSNGGDTTPDS
jgi:undecaprenyl-diphosphatase